MTQKNSCSGPGGQACDFSRPVLSALRRGKYGAPTLSLALCGLFRGWDLLGDYICTSRPVGRTPVSMGFGGD